MAVNCSPVHISFPRMKRTAGILSYPTTTSLTKLQKAISQIRPFYIPDPSKEVVYENVNKYKPVQASITSRDQKSINKSYKMFHAYGAPVRKVSEEELSVNDPELSPETESQQDLTNIEPIQPTGDHLTASARLKIALSIIEPFMTVPFNKNQMLSTENLKDPEEVEEVEEEHSLFTEFDEAHNSTLNGRRAIGSDPLLESYQGIPGAGNSVKDFKNQDKVKGLLNAFAFEAPVIDISSVQSPILDDNQTYSNSDPHLKTEDPIKAEVFVIPSSIDPDLSNVTISNGNRFERDPEALSDPDYLELSPPDSVSYEAPSYGAPSYEAPVYGGPTYEAPEYSGPVYEAASNGSTTIVLVLNNDFSKLTDARDLQVGPFYFHFVRGNSGKIGFTAEKPKTR